MARLSESPADSYSDRLSPVNSTLSNTGDALANVELAGTVPDDASWWAELNEGWYSESEPDWDALADEATALARPEMGYCC